VTFTRVAAVLGFLAVVLGAFGAHGLRARLGPQELDVWRTAALYHLVHAVALLAVALAGGRVRRGRLVCGLWTAGIVVFAGTLYLLAVTGVRWLGAITPLGGAAFLGGWLVLAVSAVKRE
jgi:uncharacterized membrane protein YgdD (TMEM256/DUF423 family)